MTRKPTPDDKDRQEELPSVPDAKSDPGKHDEPDADVRPDRVPDTGFTLGRGTESRADLRIRVEALLSRRDSASPDQWTELGDEARTLLVDLLDDWSVRSHDAVFHRVIAAVGDLRVKRSVGALGAILQDRSVGNLTKAYAANALGRIGERTAVDALALSLDVNDEMVRRQVAMALGRIDDDDAIPHLLRLRGDASVAVSEVAGEAVQRWEQQVGHQLGLKQRSPRPRPTAGKRLPAGDD